MAAAVGRRGIEQPIQAQQTASFFTTEKITRLALKILSWIAFGGAIFAGAHVIAGTISAWHALSALALAALSNMTWQKAKTIVDLNDPGEVEALRNASDFTSKNMSEWLETYPLETILQYNLVNFELLRGRCYVELLGRTDHPLPVLKQNADKLLQHRIITPGMHRALVNDDVAFFEALPGNRIDMEQIFRAFDEQRA